MLETCLVLSILALIVSILTFAFAMYYFIELKAMQKSTHQIQMVPVDDFGKVQQTIVQKDQMADDLDNII